MVFINVRHWLLILFLVCFLAETLLTRLGMRWRWYGWKIPQWNLTMDPRQPLHWRAPKPVVEETSPIEATSPLHTASPPIPSADVFQTNVPASDPQQVTSARRQRFARAKERGK